MQTPKPVSYQATIRDLTKRLEALERYNRSLSAGLARDPSTGAMTVRMSGDTGNQAGFGSDGGVYIPGSSSPFTITQGLVTADSPMTVSLGTGSVAARHVGEHTYAAGDRVWVLATAGTNLIIGNVDDPGTPGIANNGFEFTVPEWGVFHETVGTEGTPVYEDGPFTRDTAAKRTGSYGTRTSTGYYQPGRYGDDGSVNSALTSPAPGFAVTAGHDYTASIWARLTWRSPGGMVQEADTPPTANQVQCAIYWYTGVSSATLIGISTGSLADLVPPPAPTGADSSGDWLQVTVTGSAPSGAKYGRLRVARWITGATVTGGGDALLHPFFIDCDDAAVTAPGSGGGGSSAQLLTGTITAVTDPTVSVTIGGTPHTGVGHLSSYQPQDSDTVVVADTGSDLIVLGTPGAYVLPGVKVFIQADAPTGAATGDLWLQTWS